MRHKKLLAIFFAGSFFISLTAFAQTDSVGLTIAATYQLAESAQPGDIISLEQPGNVLVRSHTEYDQNYFGIYVENPDVNLRRSASGVPIVQSGIVRVNVMALGGNIVVGDFITTSSIPGKGKKGNISQGFVVGKALESFTANHSSSTLQNGLPVGSIRVMLGIASHASVISKENSPANSNTTTVPLRSQPGVNVDAYLLLRFLLGAAVALSALYLGFTMFRKNLSTGMESLGRNPLAKSSIQTMMIINAILIIITVLIGVFLGILIITL